MAQITRLLVEFDHWSSMTASRSPSSRVQKRMGETRERLVKAALELFAERGFEATTVAEITRRADVGKGTFFTHFPSKEAVIHDIGARLVGAAHASLGPGAPAPSAPAAERIVGVFVEVARWHQREHELSRLYVEAILRSLAVIAADSAARDQLLATLTSLVAEGQARGEIDAKAVAPQVALIVSGTYFGVFFQWETARRAGVTLDLEALLRTAIGAVVRGFAP
jgi:AcrR family transcriptional regulator